MPCFFKLVSWMRAKDLTMTAQPPRCLGSNAAQRPSGAGHQTLQHKEQNEPRQLTSVLSAGAFAVVLVTDDNPFEAGSLRAN
jgi:hypothetical protein